MKLLNLLTITLFTVLWAVFLLNSPIYAHRSGCHRWHSCPSDSGSYSCGDLGYPCNYPTYPEGGSSGGNYYYLPVATPAPTPDVPNTANWTFSRNSSNKCNSDIVINWEKTKIANRFSVKLAKYATDPGPIADTSSNSYSFTNISAGKWYFNLKSGNGIASSLNYYWTLDVPIQSSYVNANTYPEKKQISYDTGCIKTLTVEPLISKISNPISGSLTVATTSATKYTFTGKGYDGMKYTQIVNYDPNPTLPPLTNSVSNNTQTTNDSGWGLGAIIAVIFFGGCAILVIYKLIEAFINYTKTHDWVWTAIFWGVIIILGIIFSK